MLCPVEDAGPVAGNYPLDHMPVAGIVAVEYHVNAGLVKRYRIQAGGDTDVLHLGSSRMAVTVAIDAQPVYYIDIEYLLPEMIDPAPAASAIASLNSSRPASFSSDQVSA